MNLQCGIFKSPKFVDIIFSAKIRLISGGLLLAHPIILGPSNFSHFLPYYRFLQGEGQVPEIRTADFIGNRRDGQKIISFLVIS